MQTKELRPVFCSQCGCQQGMGIYGFSACKEHEAVAADTAYNKLKNTGELQRREAARTAAEERKWVAA